MKLVVIGAGVAGLAIGWRLRQAGAEVTVLERFQPARAATWASAGMISVAGEMGQAQATETEFARHSSSLWPGFAKEIEAASGRAIAYRRDGALIVESKVPEPATRATGSGAQWLDAAQALAKAPMLTPDMAGAFWALEDAQVDSRALGQALATAFTRAGGNLCPDEPATRLEVRAGRAHAVVTPRARHEADAFVLAAGAWSGALDGMPAEAILPVRPVKGEMIALAPPPGIPLPGPVVWGHGIYLVPRGDRLLVGATMSETGFDTAVTAAAADWLSDRATRLMPALAGWRIVEHWAGLRPGSPDDLPLLGRTAVDGLFAATGQFRNGILFAPAIAENMSRLVLEHAAEIPAFDPRRFLDTARAGAGHS